jgi:hypothetical protein
MRRTFVVVCALAGCPAEPPPPCITTIDLACAPGYVPSFDNVYANTLEQKCGSDKSACHSALGRAGGLSFEDQATAHAQLLLEGRVKPGDAMCSEMIVRTSSPGADYQMPPGDELSPQEACALIQWVQQGAMP